MGRLAGAFSHEGTLPNSPSEFPRGGTWGCRCRNQFCTESYNPPGPHESAALLLGDLKAALRALVVGHFVTPAGRACPGTVVPSAAQNAGPLPQCTQGSRVLAWGAGSSGAQSPCREMLRRYESLLLKSDLLSSVFVCVAFARR